MRSRDQDHPGQHSETLSLLKIEKLAVHDGTWEAEFAMSRDHATAFQPGDRVRLHLKKQQQQNNTTSKLNNGPGAVGHVFWEAEVGGSPEVGSF